MRTGASPRAPSSRHPRSRRPSSTSAPRPTDSATGPSRPVACTGMSRSRRCSTGRTRRSPSGTPMASSTSPTTASTGTSSTGDGDRVAFHWEGEPGDTRTITYAELTAEVKRAANMLADLGVRQGDRSRSTCRVIPEAVVAMLAIARLGAVHSVVFGGFSAESLRVAHRGRRTPSSSSPPTAATARARSFPLKPVVDAAARGRDPGRECARREARRERHRLGRRPRRLVARASGRGAPSTRRRPSRPRTRSSSSTPRAPPASRRASCTPAAATSPRSRPRTRRSSTCTPRPTSTGARPTSAGSPVTATSSTARSPTVPPRCSTKAPPTPRIRAAGGSSSRSTGVDPLHRAHRDPLLHEARARDPRRVRSLEPARAGQRRRTDQPRGVDLVPRCHRRRPRADRRHLVADRDRRRSWSARCRASRSPSRAARRCRCRASRSMSSTTTACGSATTRAGCW